MKFDDRINDLFHERHGRPSYAFDLIRIFLGITLFLKGISFLSHTDYLVGLIGGTGSSWVMPALIAHYVILAHLAGGIGMILGLVTRISVICQIPILLGAIFYVHLPRVMPRTMYMGEVQNLEYAVLVLFLMILVALRGAGNWSLDHLVFDEKKKEGQWPEPPNLPVHG
ncbi:MAG TPA: DoxX family protein [Blastocatellia bacterium]|nr:DoxX family protein [Blastocatellia bacterium]